jgi:hypothetical protein
LPPAIVVLALVAAGVPAGVRAVFGRPRSLARACLLALALAASAQALGELAGVSLGVVGDAQLLLAVGGAAAAAVLVALAEGPAKR